PTPSLLDENMGCGTLHRPLRRTARNTRDDGRPRHPVELNGLAVREERDAAHEFLRGLAAGPAGRLHDGQVGGDAACCAWDRARDRDPLVLPTERLDDGVPL